MPTYSDEGGPEAGHGSWQRYEIDTFVPAFESEAESESTFSALQAGDEKSEAFMPLQEYGSDQDGRSRMDAILEEAKERAASIEREAYEKGFEQGERDGLELGEEKAKRIVGSIEGLLNEIHGLRAEIVRIYEKQILEAVFAIASKIIRTEAGMNEETVRSAVIDAVRFATEKHDLTLRINPDDFDYVESLRPELFAEFRELKSMAVTTDPAITRGGCLIESSRGTIDARIETQLESIRKCLEEAGRERRT